MRTFSNVLSPSPTLPLKNAEVVQSYMEMNWGKKSLPKARNKLICSLHKLR